MPFYYYNDGNISYSDQGEGNPIVLIHGFPLDKRQWDPQVNDLLANGHRVISYDMRGFGKSDIPTSKYSHKEDLNGLLDYLNIEKNIHIVASSYGAIPAMELASNFTKRIKAFTLLSPSPGTALSNNDKSFLRYSQLAKEGKLKDLQKEIMSHEAMKSLRNYPEAYSLTTTIIKDYIENKDAWHFQNKDPVKIERDLDKLMTKIECPTQILFGSKDYEFSKKAAHFINSKINNSTISEIEGVGHLLNIENPEIVNNAILEFD